MTTAPLQDRFINMIEDVETFKQVLEDTFRDWHGSFDVLMEQTGTYLFNAKQDPRFCAFCAKLRSTEAGEAMCKRFDDDVHMHLRDKTFEKSIYACHAGLIDSAVPIYVEGKLVATILFGQVLVEDKAGQAHFRNRAQSLDENLGFRGELVSTVGQVPVVTEAHVLRVRARLERIAKLVSDQLRLKIKLNREHQHLMATQIVHETSERLSNLQMPWDEFWTQTSEMMERMRVLVGAVCGMILLPSRGEYQGLHAVSALCGLPRDVFARRYKLPVEMLEKMSSARGLIEYVDEQPGPIRQSINEYDAAVGARIDKLFLIKMDFRGLGEGVLVYFINNQEDVARGSLKIDNGDSIERSVLAQFAGAISLAFNNRRINERSMRFRNERRQWLEQVSHQIVQSIGVVRTSAHGITNWAIELGKINPHAYSEWSSDDIKFFFDRMDEVFYGSNNALRVAQNLKRSVFNPRDEKNIDWEWEIEPDVPGLLIQIARDFQAMAKEYGLRRLHVETVGLSQLNDRLNLISTEELFRQAVANLLENAVKYSYRGGEIIVDGQLAGNQGIIDITNEGIQLLADDIERIFEYGYRSPQAIKRNAPGTGIGLKVARDIIEFHGGKLTAKPSVRSERMLEGKITWLTTFTIHLPLQKQR